MSGEVCCVILWQSVIKIAATNHCNRERICRSFLIDHVNHWARKKTDTERDRDDYVRIASEIESPTELTITSQHHKSHCRLHRHRCPKIKKKIQKPTNIKTKRILWFWFYGLSIRNALSYDYFALLIIRIMFLFKYPSLWESFASPPFSFSLSFSFFG